MFHIDKNNKVGTIVQQIHDYVEEQGIKISSFNENDGSPYIILGGGTGMGYRTTSKQGRKGIVLYCSQDGVDKDNITEEFPLIVYENAQASRPYCIFIPEQLFEDVVELLTRNPKNR